MSCKINVRKGKESTIQSPGWIARLKLATASKGKDKSGSELDVG